MNSDHDFLLLRDEPGYRSGEPTDDEYDAEAPHCFQCSERMPLDTAEEIGGRVYCSDCAYEMRRGE